MQAHGQVGDAEGFDNGQEDGTFDRVTWEVGLVRFVRLDLKA